MLFLCSSSSPVENNHATKLPAARGLDIKVQLHSSARRKSNQYSAFDFDILSYELT